MYLFNEMHTDSEQIAVPHPPQCAHWGTFPPGEGIALRHLDKFQFTALLSESDKHILLLRFLSETAECGAMQIIRYRILRELPRKTLFFLRSIVSLYNLSGLE